MTNSLYHKGSTVEPLLFRKQATVTEIATKGPEVLQDHSSTGRKYTLTDEITNRLVTALATGEYLPGSRLPSERELATLLQVGRVTIRSAIANLIEMNLLVAKQGRGGGTFVVEASTPAASAAIERSLSAVWDQLIDLHDAEAWMHGVVAEAAACHRTDSDVKKIFHRLEQFRQASSGSEKQQADEAFHLAITEATHNNSLAQLLTSLERQMHLQAPRHPWGSGQRWESMERRALEEHQQIAEAIAQQDPLTARTIGKQHAGINKTHLEDALRDARKAIRTDTNKY